MQKIFISGRYKDQVANIKHEISMKPELKWEPVNDPDESDLILCFDRIDATLLKKPSKKIFIRQEPKMILPQNYKTKNLSKFDLIIDVGASRKSNLNSINWPQKINLNSSNKTEPINSKTVLINSNLLSLDNDEMYSLRRTIAYKSKQIDLYGFGWNIGIIKRMKVIIIELRKFIKRPKNIKFSGAKYFFKNQINYKGSVSNKIQVMGEYRTALVIENSINYVSEKIFDAFLAGCIPVYVGPELDQYEIPKNLYIQAKPTYESVITAMSKAQEINFNKWINDLENWLRSDLCKENWSEDTFLLRLKNIINGKTTSSNHLLPYQH
jgi:hypothetical protein